MSNAERIAAIWADVFDRPGVAPDDDFFELGGGSVQAVEIAGRVRDDLGIDIPLRLFFESSTVAELATAIEALP